MSIHERAPLRSPLRSPTVLLSAIRGWMRRRRFGRVIVLIAVGAAALLRVTAAVDAADAERARWGPSTPAWVTTAAISAGSVVEPSVVSLVEVPSGLVPVGAITVDPTGQRARVDLAAGEIVLGVRVTGDHSAHAARVPAGMVAVALDRTSDLFEVGDPVDLHDQIDGARLTAEALVVAVTDRDVAVAVDARSIDAIVRSLGRGGVVAVLRGG